MDLGQSENRNLGLLHRVTVLVETIDHAMGAAGSRRGLFRPFYLRVRKSVWRSGRRQRRLRFRQSWRNGCSRLRRPKDALGRAFRGLPYLQSSPAAQRSKSRDGISRSSLDAGIRGLRKNERAAHQTDARRPELARPRPDPARPLHFLGPRRKNKLRIEPASVGENRKPCRVRDLGRNLRLGIGTIPNAGDGSVTLFNAPAARLIPTDPA